jgi:hypothetical protein
MKILLLSERGRIELRQAIDNAIACLELRYFKYPPNTIAEVLFLANKIQFLIKLKQKI